jgi:hypothetical protein
MTTATEVIQAVEANGGTFTVEGGTLVIDPYGAAKSVLGELRAHKQSIISLLIERDAARWRGSFERWLKTRCVSRPRDFGGLNVLHRSFNEWEKEQGGDASCSIDVFEWLLAEFDYVVADVCGNWLVAGLMLKSDVDAIARYDMPAKMPAKRRSDAGRGRAQ